MARITKELTSPLEAGDASAVTAAAHASKGLAGEFRATPAYHAAEWIEIQTASGSLEGIALRVSALKTRIEQLLVDDKMFWQRN